MMEFNKGETVIVVDINMRPVGEGVVNYYVIADRKYSVNFIYELAEEEEEIKLPVWMLRKKPRREYASISAR
jgi:hypothetical protein